MAPDDTVAAATLDIAAPADRIFELIADPARQPEWDGNDNLAEAAEGQRVHGVGDVFDMRISQGPMRENHVEEFEEGRLIAWRPSEPGARPPGHLWRWELTPVDDGHTRVTHTYDWSQLTDENRMARARATGEDALMSSLKKLATVAERA
ncbi:polyketide cyclase [Mycolicibacterium sp. P1-18]|uniref:SRPBCC family protein n=1 Tax=Mycolicibacterium sp. P1-18 TaxID=2024615 RepID=UPI0011F25989|nr:SRPBCC family protein [Mycolicibacterium sp. P1-18]KAA0101981.1 polyketide cyclase [Mycolicibacterium sp. P1-18]